MTPTPFDAGKARVLLEAGTLHAIVLELRVTRYSGAGTKNGAPDLAGGRGKAVSLEWESDSQPRGVISADHLYYLDELPIINASSYANNGIAVKHEYVAAKVVSSRTVSSTSYAEGLGLALGEAGQALLFDIFPCDVFANRRDDISMTPAAARAFDPLATSKPQLKFDALLGFKANISLVTPNLGAAVCPFYQINR